MTSASSGRPRNEEDHREWYYEEWLRFPQVGETRARQAADRLRPYGEALFAQVFNSDTKVYAKYEAALKDGLRETTIEVSGTPAFHSLLWETLWDPDDDEPLSTQATVLRQHADPPQIDLQPRTSPTLNILLMVARPSFPRDVAYRTIARPLVDLVTSGQIRAQIDLVRPGTWEAFCRHLEAHPPGHYHIVHFDMHGALMTSEEYKTFMPATAQGPAARGHAAPRQPSLRQLATAAVGRIRRPHGFPVLQRRPAGQPVPASADQVAELLRKHQVPIGILNACQSAKQVYVADGGPAEADAAMVATAPETSLGAVLMDAGTQLVLAMRYSVMVTAAENFMRELYAALLAGRPPAEAVRQGRLALWHEKSRRGGYDQTRDLEDWPLPVLIRTHRSKRCPSAILKAWRRKQPSTASGLPAPAGHHPWLCRP